MTIGIMTREYPPHVYGGGGVHVDHLVRHLRGIGVPVQVHCLGEARPGATAHSTAGGGRLGPSSVLAYLSADLSMAEAAGALSLVHSHTWYANMAGRWAQLLHDIPHVATVHSLEPLRPWKADQLGGGYRVSSWAERGALESADALIAVSRATGRDIVTAYPRVDPDRIHVISNGVDADLYFPDQATEVVERLGVDLDKPYVCFVGRTTKQKGLPHLLRAGLQLDPAIQMVVLAGAADTPELADETQAAATQLRRFRTGTFFVPEMLQPEEVRQILTHSAVFCCPSIYEPQGIVNLEAMACGVPVVATDTGGIPDIVTDGVTGVLVPPSPSDPRDFEQRLAKVINDLIADPALADQMGRAGRARAVADFSWTATAKQTRTLYETLI